MAVKLLDEYKKPHRSPQSQLSQSCAYTAGIKPVNVSRGQGSDSTERHWSVASRKRWGHIASPEGQLFGCFMRSQKSGFLWAIFQFKIG